MPSTALVRRGRPKPQSHYAQLRAGTSNVRVPVARVDWSRVRCCEKRVWRSYTIGTVKGLPRPIIVYSIHPATAQRDTAVVLLTETWVELLGAVTDEAIHEEGFDSRAEFKRYFAARYPNVGYRPLNKVQVYRIRPLTDEDVEAWKEHVWQRCYGSFA